MAATGMLIYGTLISTVAAAEVDQPLHEIQARVREFLLARQSIGHDDVQIQVAGLDPRLHLTRCHAPLQVFLPAGARGLGNTSVGVSCAGPRPWTVYLSAKVKSFDTVLTTNRFIPRGTRLAATDLRQERRDIGSLPGGYETEANRLVGKVLRRPLQPGTVISPRMVVSPPMIRRGDQVTLLISHGGIEVSSLGVALRDAGLGDHVRIRNKSSDRIVEGTVVAAHRVKVDI